MTRTKPCAVCGAPTRKPPPGKRNDGYCKPCETDRVLLHSVMRLSLEDHEAKTDRHRARIDREIEIVRMLRFAREMRLQGVERVRDVHHAWALREKNKTGST